MTALDWVANRLGTVVCGDVGAPEFVAAAELVRRKRVMDFSCSAGVVTARVHDERDRTCRVSFQVVEFTEEEWHRLAAELSGEALFLASLLAGVFPPEMVEIESRLDLLLVPASPGEILASCDCDAGQSRCIHRAALVHKLIERCSEDAFLLFTIRGRGREEILHTVLRLRAELRSQNRTALPRPDTPQLVERELLDRYWTSRPELFQERYTIRADELPAALLKRLDPLPGTDPDAGVDIALEDAYARIARRAQAFGLGLMRGRTS